MRILAYAQLLESYSSLTMESLSKAFGVSEAFVDKYVWLSLSSFQPLHWIFISLTFSHFSDLTTFISLSRIPASIDKVHGIVYTTRPSLKNAQYEAVVKQGDVLLNEVQRLSKVLV